MTTIKKFLKSDVVQNNFGAGLYLIILLILNVGVIQFSGSTHLGKMAIVIVSFITFYLVFSKFSKQLALPTFSPSLKDFIHKYGHFILAGMCLFIVVLDLIYLNGLPGLKLFNTQTTTQVINLRNDIHSDSPSWMVYLSGFNIRCFFPFLLLVLFIGKRKYLFTFCLIIGAIYIFGFLQKSFIIFLLLPTIIYAVTQRKFLVSLLLIAVMIATISVIIIGSSDKVNDDPNKNKTEQIEKVSDDRPFALRIALGMSIRIFITPGEMVAAWFDNVPKNKHFLYGDGYPIIPRLKGTEYHDYNQELYPIIRPKYAERGFEGSVNCATFMREYSNFGSLGLVLSSFLLAFFFTAIRVIFKNAMGLNLALNMMFILMLSSTNLLTLLLSGGWFMTLMLFIIFKDSFALNKLKTSNDRK
jgi:hypothetical protein